MTTDTTTTQSCFQRFATAGERGVTRNLVRELLRRGYAISVQDGEEWTVKLATKETPVFDALATTGGDLIRARDAEGKAVATFSLIWGNDETGEELIADYTDNDVANEVYKIVCP